MTRILAALAVVLGSGLAEQAVSVLGDDPTKFDQLFDAAILRRDVAFIEAAAAADARFTNAPEPGAAALNRAQLVDAVRTYKGAARTVDSVKVEQHGDVIETVGRIQIRMDDAGAAETQMYYVRLYRHGPAGWQFVSHRTLRTEDTPVAPAAPAPRADAQVKANASDAEHRPVRAHDEGVTLPRVLREVKPQYTAAAMKAKIQGTVLLECTVETNGTVSNATILRSLDSVYGLDEEAIRAAKAWRFAPGHRNGQPVPVIITLELTFILR